MKDLRPTAVASILIGVLILLGCSGNLATTEFTNPQFDFGFVERIAVLPLEDLAEDRRTGVRAAAPGDRLALLAAHLGGRHDAVRRNRVPGAGPRQAAAADSLSMLAKLLL